MANTANMMNNNNSGGAANGGQPDLAQLANSLPPEYRQMADRMGGIEALAQNPMVR